MVPSENTVGHRIPYGWVGVVAGWAILNREFYLKIIHSPQVLFIDCSMIIIWILAGRN